jgi:hypothetical protein
MTARLALAQPSPEAKAAIDDLLFDDAADFAATIGALSVRVGAACEQRNLIRAQQHFALLRLAALSRAASPVGGISERPRPFLFSPGIPLSRAESSGPSPPEALSSRKKARRRTPKDECA